MACVTAPAETARSDCHGLKIHDKIHDKKAGCRYTTGGSTGGAHRVERGGDEDVDARQQLVQVCTRSAA